jgi:hypothetical protein
VRERHPAALEFDSRAAGVVDQFQDAHVHAPVDLRGQARSRDLKASAVGRRARWARRSRTPSCRDPDQHLVRQPRCGAGGAYSRQRARREARRVAHATEQSPGVAAHERVHEQTTAVAAWIELAGAHLVVDPACSERALDRLDILSSDISSLP